MVIKGRSFCFEGMFLSNGHLNQFLHKWRSLNLYEIQGSKVKCPLLLNMPWKKNQLKLKIFLPLRTIYFRTFQCEIPCTLDPFLISVLWSNGCELQFHNPKNLVLPCTPQSKAMKRNIAFRKFDQFSSSICPIHLRMNIFYKIHKSLVRFSAHFRSIKLSRTEIRTYIAVFFEQ